VKPHPNPKVALEQYTIPADLAADILFTACYIHNDVRGKRVLDLGTGTGRLALGASILRAGYVVGVDVDASSIEQAAIAAKSLRVHVDFVHGMVDTIHGPVDTVLMNPPFGTKKRHADIEFLKTALKVGRTVYSIHKSSTREFLERWLQKRGFNVERLLVAEMEIPHQFSFHRKRRQTVSVDAIRITRRRSCSEIRPYIVA